MSATYELVQDRLGTSLDERLRYWRAARLSAPAIARLLAAETRVQVTGQTVRRWIANAEAQAS